MNKAHGTPYDRGSADSYYQRAPNPHWYPMGTGNGRRIEEYDMSSEEITEYFVGYNENEKLQNFKDFT